MKVWRTLKGAFNFNEYTYPPCCLKLCGDSLQFTNYKLGPLTISVRDPCSRSKQRLLPLWFSCKILSILSSVLMRPICPVHLPNDLVYVITTCRDYKTSRSSHCTSFNLRFNFLTQVFLMGFFVLKCLRTCICFCRFHKEYFFHLLTSSSDSVWSCPFMASYIYSDLLRASNTHCSFQTKFRDFV